jgi:short-subunit dehydrogenase
MSNRFILLGASRGLGWATYQQLVQQNEKDYFLLISRRIEFRKKEILARTETLSQDFSQTPVRIDFLQQLQNFSASHLIYFAGGGPYGNFADKKWSDHTWSLNTSFLYPAELLHAILSQPNNWRSLKKMIFVGSAIAEDQADPKSASYAAAKHALKGLITSIQNENPALALDLFSPGYMQTELLPANSEPRQKGLAQNPVDVAKKLIATIEKND